MSKFFITLSLLFTGLVIYTPLLAQGESDYIPFFNGYGMRWNGNTFIADVSYNKNRLTNSTWAFEGASSICDRMGNLKLYTDGFSIINKEHGLNSNGLLACFGLDSFCTSTQGTLMIPHEGNYWIFTTKANYGRTQETPIFAYSVLDSNLNIIKKNININSNISSEALHSVRHANARDWWVVTLETDTIFKNQHKALIYLICNDSLHFIVKKKLTKTDSNQFYINSFTISNKGDKMYYSGSGVNGAMCLYSVNRHRFALDSIRDYSYRFYYPGTNWNVRPAYSSVFSPNDSLIISADYIISAHDFKITYIDGNKLTDGYIGVCLKNNSVYMMGKRGTLGRIIDANKFVLDSTNFEETPLLPYNPQQDYFMPRVPPNYSLGPELHPGFEAFASRNCHQITVTDTSWGHFYRVWDWGDGSPKDTFEVVQHAEYLPGLLDTFKTVSHTYSQPGTYTVTLQILNPYTPYKLPAGQFLKDTIEKQVVIPDCIYPQASLRDSSICPNKAVEIKYLGSKNYQTLTMFYGDGSSETKNYPDSIFTHTYSQSGTYSLFLQASNADIDTLHPVGKIQVIECPDYLYVYPNPITENLTIHYKQSTDFELVLYNSIGQSVWTKSVLAGEKSEQYALDLAAGVYVLRAKSQDKELKVMKLVKM